MTEHPTAHSNVPTLLQRLLIESSVIVFHDSYIILTLKVSSGLSSLSNTGWIGSLWASVSPHWSALRSRFKLLGKGLLFNIHAGLFK